jgi:hypothetical protein
MDRYFASLGIHSDMELLAVQHLLSHPAER